MQATEGAQTTETAIPTTDQTADADLDAFALASAAFEQGGGEDASGAEGGEGEPSSPDSSSPPDGGQPQPSELEALRAENERLKAESKPAEPTVPPEMAKAVPEVRRWLGLDPMWDGGPTVEQLQQLTDARDYQALAQIKRADGGVGLSLEEAIDLKRQGGERRTQYGTQLTVAHSAAWGAIGAGFDQVTRELGMDPEALTKELGQAESPLQATAFYLGKIRDAERKAGKEESAREWKGKYDAAQAEISSLKARVAGEAEPLESGGRGGSRNGAASALALADRNPDEFVERAIRGDFAGLDLRDEQ